MLMTGQSDIKNQETCSGYMRNINRGTDGTDGTNFGADGTNRADEVNLEYQTEK